MNFKDEYKAFLKSNVFSQLRDIETDQKKELPEPSIQKNCNENSILIDLTPPSMLTSGRQELLTILRKRKTRRIYSNESLTLEELSFLLWSTQGVKKIIKNGYATLRTVPSGGARHTFETYLIVFNVEDLKKGVYRYLPLEHKLVFLFTIDNMEEELTKACLNQQFPAKSAVTFVWSTVPYRGEWRYAHAAYKLIALDAGHVCQNLYLACESIDAGTCAIASYNQEKIDSLLKLDGENEFTIYIAPVGKQ